MQQQWLEGAIKGTTESRWLPVFRARPHEHVLGVTAGGTFVGGTKEPVALSDYTGARFVFLLEHRLDELRSAVQSALTAAGLPNLEIPVQPIVAAGLRMRSDYWAALAASWLEQHGKHCPELDDAIMEAVQSRWAAQRTRHRLRPFLRRLSLSQMEPIARDATRTALMRCRPLTDAESASLTLGSGIEGDEGVFELYLPATRPQDAKVISRAIVSRHTGAVHVEVFIEPK
jgi:hypothetical protein